MKTEKNQEEMNLSEKTGNNNKNPKILLKRFRIFIYLFSVLGKLLLSNFLFTITNHKCQ